MNWEKRIEILDNLREYLQGQSPELQEIKIRAGQANAWFTPEFINKATEEIYTHFLNKETLEAVSKKYGINAPKEPKLVGLVMAGNIPLVGFHDFLCVYLAGHKQLIKPSAKDEILLKHIVEKLYDWGLPKDQISFADGLMKNCDAYIATGGNNSGKYFDYYFSKYPHIIRKNRTSVAVLTNNDTNEDLNKLADDIAQYFGLGCRNVTYLLAPTNYNFEPLIVALKKYEYFDGHKAFKNNFDYQLAIQLLSKQFYMSSGCILLCPSEKLFSPIAQVNYGYYTNEAAVEEFILNNANQIQAVMGKNYLPFGAAQSPSFFDYADGVDTMEFLINL
jgi:hypothetical protein